MEHFVHFNINAVQFIGTVAKVTFAVEASKQHVISHQSININGVLCAVPWGSPARRIFLFTITPWRVTTSPSAENLGCMGLSRVLLSIIGCICQMLVMACGWSAWSTVMQASSRSAICVRPLAILHGCAPEGQMFLVRARGSPLPKLPPDCWVSCQGRC